MSAAAPAAATSLPVRPAALGVLAAAMLFLGYLSSLPEYGALVLAVGAVILSAGLRTVPRSPIPSYAPVPVLVALVVGAATAPVARGTEIVTGLAGLAFLVWLADDPTRPAGGAVRGLSVIALPALALGLAWTSALFLPSGAVPLGVAGALLALVLGAVAFLLGEPALFDREGARS